jgi:hypothetical protein
MTEVIDVFVGDQVLSQGRSKLKIVCRAMKIACECFATTESKVKIINILPRKRRSRGWGISSAGGRVTSSNLNYASRTNGRTEFGSNRVIWDGDEKDPKNRKRLAVVE